ncbi:MAG TPA: molybdopterin-binding protein, partial [Nitrospiraceae bacterium]|nr:molybdopterin-binding protein [Nitrospiraceae bacterium]
MHDLSVQSIEHGVGTKMIPLSEAVGMVIAHDITEIRQGEYKGRAFKKGRIVREEDIEHLRNLGKENLFVLSMADDEMHEDEAAYAIATALMGEGVAIREEPKEGKINIVAARDGLLTMNKKALLQCNMLGEVMCATLHGNTLVKTGQVVAGTRAIPLVIKKKIVEETVAIASQVRSAECEMRRNGVIEVKELRKPRAGIVITGNEIFYGRKEDAFAPVIRKKVEAFGGEIVRVHYAPDDASYIR